MGHTLLLSGVGLDIDDISDLVGDEVGGHGDDSLVCSSPEEDTNPDHPSNTRSAPVARRDEGREGGEVKVKRRTYVGSPS